MTTTERGPRAAKRAEPPVRAYLIVALATLYVVVWWRLGAPASSTASRPPVVRAPVPDRPRAVWFADVPVADRPAVLVPEGWHLADRVAPPTSTRPARRTVRVSSRRSGRVRTRSS